MIIIQTPEDMKKYYDKNTNTYRFVDSDGNREDVTIQCDIKVYSHINARDVNAWNVYALNIDARDVNAWNVYAWNIDALNISYHAVCIAYETFKCKSVKGRRENAVHMCLDGDIEYKVGDNK